MDREELIRRRIRAAAEDTSDAARLSAEAALDAAEDVLGAVQAYLRRQYRERPIATTATAIGAGLVLGLLLSRRR